MPSGRKKRKAAKKKVEEGNNSTHSHGDDDPKNNDGKESDGGEVGSPASQDHHNRQHPFTEGEDEEEEEKREDNSAVRSFVTENSSLEGVNYDGESTQKGATEEKGVVQIDRDLMSEEHFESKNIVIESAKESYDGGSSSGSSSSSSSDDESHVLEKKSVMVETASPLYSDKLVDSLAEVVAQVNDSILVGEVNHSVVETVSVVESDDKLLEQVVHANESASIDNPMTFLVVVESGLKENGDKKLLSLDENAGVSPVVMDLGSSLKEDEIVSASNENATASSNAKVSAAQVIEDKLLMSFNAPKVDTSNGAEHLKDTETSELSFSQPLVASAPRTVQTTSWKSCCGIFELFTGSNT